MLSRMIKDAESARNLKLRRLKERVGRQNARDVLGVEQDASLRALKISEIMLEEAVATCICAELSCKVFEKGLDE